MGQNKVNVVYRRMMILTQAYLCPHCKTNRTRFNLIEQVSKPVKMDPVTGEIIEEYGEGIPDPFHHPYQGPVHKVQCAVCGIVSEEDLFVNAARNNPRGFI